jgi:lambda repressor-like predicted transcriptional regulator
MTLSEFEIVRAYREAQNKKTQISILAQMCDCTKQDIVELLELNGVTVTRKAPKAKGRYRTSYSWEREVDNLKRLRLKGYSIRECAILYGVSQDTLKKAIKRYG